MNLAQISDNLEKLVESFNKDSFIFDLLLAYGTPKATISRLKLSSESFVATSTEQTIVIKKKLFFKSVVDEHLQTVIDNLKTNEKVTKHAPRFIIVTNFETLLAYDTKTDDSLDIPILEIPQHNDFFLPWAGMEKSKLQTENIADVKAAERMAKLYDEIKKDNPTTTHEEVHNLNVFLSRLLFCFFAEDTEIFDKDLFTKSVDSHTQKDGSDLNVYLDTLFEVMNTPQSERRSVNEVEGRSVRIVELPAYLKAFPYVNGGLFRNQHAAPLFTRKSRQMLIDCGLTLQWHEINPDIFGSMIQAVITPEHRGGLGMHYTSVPNIMKVIEPLFLDELKEEFENSKGNKKKLNELLQRLWKIKIFDPACGSGNFLIIAYKELRKLEMLIFKEIDLLKGRLGSTKIDFEDITFSEINLSNFYGIELDDFAHEVATLSLWLAEHQMNQAFKKEFGRSKPSLPLQETGNIVHGNACRVDWETVCPKTINGSTELAEVYILGNPPYLGYALQSLEQREDMSIVFNGFDDYKKLDFIACWFYLGSKFIQNNNSKFAFVTTNSICQGEQVAILWPNILNNKMEIDFAYESFKWKNNAKANAAVAVTIIGIRNLSKATKRLYSEDKFVITNNVNPYLVSAANSYITARQNPISNFPNMIKGCSPGDGGNLILSLSERDALLGKYSDVNFLIKKYIGADEFMNGGLRYCIWVTEEQIEFAKTIPELNTRFTRCKEFRTNSKKEATIKKAETPYFFDERKYVESDSIIVPQTGSERREYLPVGFLNSDTIVSNAARVIYNAQPFLFGILSSKMHITWVRAVAGRLKMDMQYSNTLCYNNFPFPPISDKHKKELEQHVYNILGEREKHSEKTLAQLYDPDKMPDGLREAHRLNDLAVERCYRSRAFESDEERLEYLFKLYEQMIEEEKEKGTLFKTEKKSKKKK